MRIFISREQTAESPFREMMENAGHEVVGQSLIQFSPIEIEQLPEVDWWFFYSKRGVQFFFQQIQKDQIKDIKIGCIGKATATELESIDIKADFVGNGKPEEVAEAFLQLAKGASVLFPQALHSRQSIQQLLGSKIQGISLPVYQNKVMDEIDLPYCDVLVFTSPLNVEAYYRKYAPEKKQKVIAIGNTTKMALQKAGVEQVVVADQPGEIEMAQAVLGSVL